MKDMDWKSWSLVGIIALGLMFEVLKHLPAGNEVLWDKDALTFNLGPAQPYSVKAAANARRENLAHTHPLPVANMQVPTDQLGKFVAANTPTATEFEHKEKGAEGKPKKDKKDDEDWEVFVDPTTGKKYRRKKKKDAKIEEKKVEVAATPTPPAPTLPSPNDNPYAGLTQTAIVTPPAAAQPPVDPNKDPNTLEDWERLLLSQPDSKATTKFISLYLSGTVTADVFYKITQMMVDDSRVDMKQLGAMCAGMTPSTTSFLILANMEKVESLGSTLRDSVDGYLDRYTALQNLSILKRILSGTDSYSVALAARLVSKSAQTYLQPAASATSTSTSTPPTASSANASQFKDFLTILLPLTKSHDTGINEQANMAYNTLQSLLGDKTSAATPSTTAALPAGTTGG